MQIENVLGTAIVAGINPDDVMLKYDSNKLVSPYIKYNKSNSEALKTYHIMYCDAMLNHSTISEDEKAFLLKDKQEALKMTAEEFFDEYTSEYDHDKDGNALSSENPNGKYSYCCKGKNFSEPFKLKNGNEAFQALKKDIQWDLMHLANQEAYKRAWEMVVDGSTPVNESEQYIFDNMRNRQAYFSNFKSKEEYVIYSTAFWASAFVTDEEWIGIEPETDSYEWISNFYDRFIKPLPGNTLLTVFEYQ